jgi:hypothetical protein
MEGVITRVSVTWAEDVGAGRQERVYTVVPDAGKIIRVERLEELLDDLTLICEQLQAAQATSPISGMPAMPNCGTTWETRAHAPMLSGSTTSMSSTAPNTMSPRRARPAVTGGPPRCSASVTSYSAGHRLNCSTS